MADREGLGAEGLDRIIERAQQALASAQAVGGSAGGHVQGPEHGAPG